MKTNNLKELWDIVDELRIIGGKKPYNPKKTINLDELINEIMVTMDNIKYNNDPEYKAEIDKKLKIVYENCKSK